MANTFTLIMVQSFKSKYKTQFCLQFETVIKVYSLRESLNEHKKGVSSFLMEKHHTFCKLLSRLALNCYMIGD